LDQVANARVHATTQRRPLDLWLVEQPSLTPLTGVPPYRLAPHALRTVNSEGWVQFQGSRYSVPPPRWAGASWWNCAPSSAGW
ncbi:MAG: hypothetical protein ACRETL_06660, partial [Gammaproteobacteria bacterium]